MAITVNQIAEECGVSRTTVLRALNGRGSVARETKERILQVARENNYRPNLLARSLNHGRTMSLGVVTINIENMYFVQSLNTINKEADKRGYFTNIVVCDESLEWERKLIQGLAERQMDNLFEDATLVNGIRVASVSINAAKIEALRAMGDKARDNQPDAVCVLTTVNAGKGSILVVCGKDAVAKGAHAGKIVKDLAALCGGSGGGRPDNAMGGTSEIFRIDEAIAQLPAIVGKYVK